MDNMTISTATDVKIHTRLIIPHGLCKVVEAINQSWVDVNTIGGQFNVIIADPAYDLHFQIKDAIKGIIGHMVMSYFLHC